ncbi:SGNH/GDSL hydrolase family protein [Kocuria sp. CPCC 205268]|uniref:SGNH/GDSL hydrolase family protein n=1 Tax=Kocuria oxytropis TaxID=3058913 RepID=UPI0034D74810
MQRTPPATGQRPFLTVKARNRFNAVIVAAVILLIAGLGAAWAQNHQATTQAAEAAKSYTPVPPQPIEKPTTAAFLGDSYNVGIGSSIKAKRWTTLVAADQGWAELNYGYGGTNFATAGEQKGGRPYHDRLTDLVLSRPNIVVVSSAGNTLGIDQQPGIRKTFQALRDKLPDARIIATSPFHWDGSYPESKREFGKMMQSEVEAVDGEYLEIGHPLKNQTEHIIDDGVHPDDVGYQLIAAAVIKQLDR